MFTQHSNARHLKCPSPFARHYFYPMLHFPTLYIFYIILLSVILLNNILLLLLLFSVMFLLLIMFDTYLFIIQLEIVGQLCYY